MIMTPVTSSNLAAVGYDTDTKILHVQTKSGGTYAYADVPAEIHANLLSAESVGSYFYKNIRNTFVFTKLPSQYDSGRSAFLLGIPRSKISDPKELEGYDRELSEAAQS